MSLKLFYANGLTDDNVCLEVDTHLGKVLNLYVDNFVWQTEFWNTIFQYAANLVQCLKDVDVVALLYHVASEAQSSRTRTYDSNFDAVGWRNLGQRDVAALALKVGSEALQIADSYGRLVHLQVDTLALTLFFLWTYTTADSG